MERPLVILFDIDGTLITTGGAGARSWREAFQDLYGVPADIGEFTDSGMTDPEVGRLTFVAVIGRDPSPEEMAALMSRRLAHLPRAVAESQGYRVLDGVEETLQTLSEQGYLLGLTTGSVEAAALIKLARADLDHYFCFGGYGSDSTDRAELTHCAIERAGRILGRRLDPERVLVVGDTPRDIDAARAVGAIAVGVASGHYGEAELREAGADYVLASLRDPLPGVGQARTAFPAAQERRRDGRARAGGVSALPLVAPGSLPWLTVAQMREVDRVMVEELGISLVRMMENAGGALAQLARRLAGGDVSARRVLVLAGPGGNGGGGLVAARRLVAAGAEVEVRLSQAPEALAPLTAEQLAIVRRLGVPVGVGPAGGLGRPDLVLDCLFGYGQKGDPRGGGAALIRQAAGLRVLALDAPSGLELETGALHEPHVRAEATLTLACPKEGLRAAGAEEAVGLLYLADISVPASVYERLGVPYATPFGSSTIVRIET